MQFCSMCNSVCVCVVYRNSVLANQNKGFKEQMKTLMDKGRHDDELIEALMVATVNILTLAVLKISFLVLNFINSKQTINFMLL